MRTGWPSPRPPTAWSWYTVCLCVVWTGLDLCCLPFLPPSLPPPKHTGTAVSFFLPLFSAIRSYGMSVDVSGWLISSLVGLSSSRLIGWLVRGPVSRPVLWSIASSPISRLVDHSVVRSLNQPPDRLIRSLIGGSVVWSVDRW